VYDVSGIPVLLLSDMMIRADCHIHSLLDGRNWKEAINRHETSPQENLIRKILQKYQDLGYTYLRDGGDRWGVSVLARKLAPEYGITYRTPGAPLYEKGHYGSFIGIGYENLREYAVLVKNARKNGLDFIKIMISGLMDFNHFGVLTEPGMKPSQIRELIHIAHEEGMSVMAHANGGETVFSTRWFPTADMFKVEASFKSDRAVMYPLEDAMADAYVDSHVM
jgi:hypothetical protein